MGCRTGARIGGIIGSEGNVAPAAFRRKGHMRLSTVLHSRVVTILGVALAVAVPAVTLPRLPHVTLWPVLLGLVPWVIGKYVLCPLRWHALTPSDLGRWWHVRA